MSVGTSGSVYKRTTPAGSSSWMVHVFWRERDRRRQLKRAFRTKKEAQAALVEMLAAHQSATFVEPSKTSLGEFADAWLEGLTINGLKPSTIRGYRSNLGYLLPELGRTALQDLKVTHLDALYSKLLRSGGAHGDGLSMTTVHHVHAVINKLLSDAERKGLVVRNVARLASAPSLSVARSKGPEMAVWTPEQLASFLEAIAGNRNEALFRLMAMTGLRRGEALGLRWSDVDFAAAELRVRQAVTFVDGEEVVDSPKSRRSQRVVDLDDDTVGILEVHRRRQASTLTRVGLDAPPGDRVFTTDVGDPIRPNSVGQAFGRLVATTGVPRIRLHDLRHTHASHLLSAGVGVKIVSARLGHASASFTLDTYGHVMPGDQAAAAQAAAALLKPQRR